LGFNPTKTVSLPILGRVRVGYNLDFTSSIPPLHLPQFGEDIFLSAPVGEDVTK